MIRHFDIENRIEHKNETKHHSNRRRLIQFWHSTGLWVDCYHITLLMFFFYRLLTISSSSQSRSLLLPVIDKSLLEHQKQNQMYPDNEVWFWFGCLTRFSVLRKCFRKNENLIQRYPFLSRDLSFLGISLCFGKKVINC